MVGFSGGVDASSAESFLPLIFASASQNRFSAISTGNLDSKTTDEVLELFESLNAGGKTIVMITHEDEVAARASRAIRLRDGMIESDERDE